MISWIMLLRVYVDMGVCLEQILCRLLAKRDAHQVFDEIPLCVYVEFLYSFWLECYLGLSYYKLMLIWRAR